LEREYDGWCQCYKHAAPPEQRQLGQNVSIRQSVILEEGDVDRLSQTSAQVTTNATQITIVSQRRYMPLVDKELSHLKGLWC